jgi:hypothetical protein
LSFFNEYFILLNNAHHSGKNFEVILGSTKLLPLDNGHQKILLTDESLALQEGEIDESLKMAVLTLPSTISDSSKVSLNFQNAILKNIIFVDQLNLKKTVHFN